MLPLHQTGNRKRDETNQIKYKMFIACDSSDTPKTIPILCGCTNTFGNLWNVRQLLNNLRCQSTYAETAEEYRRRRYHLLSISDTAGPCTDHKLRRKKNAAKVSGSQFRRRPPGYIPLEVTSSPARENLKTGVSPYQGFFLSRTSYQANVSKNRGVTHRYTRDLLIYLNAAA